MNEKQRAEFEMWAKSIPLANLNRHLDGYENSSINTYWAVWQAAIASVVVELPLWEHKNGYQVYPVSDVKDSINKAGIRYE